MVKFVWLDADNGGQVPVNPDQVMYLRRTADGKTGVVMSSFGGGMDQIVVTTDAQHTAALLEGRHDGVGETLRGRKTGKPQVIKP